MLRNIQHLSSEDFRPKRLVFDYDTPQPIPFPRFEDVFQPPDAPKTREAIRETRGALGHVRKEVEDAVTRALDAEPDKLREIYAKVAGESAEIDWKVTNNALNDALHLEGTQKATATEKVRALQRVVFTALGVQKDDAAVVDGRLGPYTLAALARYAKIQNPPPVPNAEKNSRLRDYRPTGAGVETSAAEPPGAAFLTGAVRQPDGSYLLEREGSRTYLKFENGAWLWTADPNSGPWTPVVQQAESPDKKTDEVNVMLDKLTPEALQAERKRLEDFIKAAKDQPSTADPVVDAQNAAAIVDAERALAALKPLATTEAPPAVTGTAPPSASPWSTELPVTPNPVDHSAKSPEDVAYEQALAAYNKAGQEYTAAKVAWEKAEQAYQADSANNDKLEASNKAGAAEVKAKKALEEAEKKLQVAYQPFVQGPPAPPA